MKNFPRCLSCRIHNAGSHTHKRIYEGITILKMPTGKETLKGVAKMGKEVERQNTLKAMAYDLVNLVDQMPEKDGYTKDEIKELIKAYVIENSK